MTRPHDPALADALQGPVVEWSTRVESWYAGERLHDDLPVVGGTIKWDATNVIETAEGSVEVPLGDLGPIRAHDHPLNAYGQVLRPINVLRTAGGRTFETPLGWHRIRTTPNVQDSVATASLRDLSVLVEWARTITPTQYGFPNTADPADFDWPADQALMWILTGILAIRPLDALDSIKGGVYAWRDRYAAVGEVLTAASAYARVDESGTFVMMSADRLNDLTPELTLSDGDEGTLIELRPDENASKGYNACIVEGLSPEGAPIYGADYLTTGPMAWPVLPMSRTPYGARPGFFASPLLRTPDACIRAARTILRRWMQGSEGTFEVDAVPDPRYTPNTVVNLVQGDEPPALGRVLTVELPMTVNDGPMKLTGVLL